MRTIFVLFLICFMISCQESGTKDKVADHRPNVIFILADDQGWGDLSMHGNTNVATPNIDQLGAEGVVFDHFYVSPVCSPTRAEILTGRYHARGGVYSTSAGGERLDLDETTMATIFKNAGYRTAAYGKWHNGMQHPYHPNARGFEEFYGFCSGHWGNYFNPLLEQNTVPVQGNGFLTDDLTEHAMAFMESNQSEPFFVFLPYNTPHSPMQVPDRWWDKYKDRTLDKLHRDADREDIEHTKAALAMTENIDWNVGRLMAHLEDLELDENTIVIYLSDNGPNGWRWNGGMKGRKGSTDEGGVRSPLMIRWKGNIPSGQHINEITSAIDLLPTLQEMTGVKPTNIKPLDGRSLMPLLTGTTNAWPSRLVYNHWNKNTSVRSQQYLLDANNQLFDMVSDPGQLQDVSSAFVTIKEELVHAKEKWTNEVLSELPTVDERPFPVGHVDAEYTQLPARDARSLGGIIRSNRYPNCSYFTNWTSLEDSIIWDIEVLETGTYEVEIYYTCTVTNVGSRFQLSFLKDKLEAGIQEAHDPPLIGMEQDRVPRTESYVKDFRPLDVGHIYLEKGRGAMVLNALEIAREEVMDFRLLLLRRIE